jgi:thiosulfate/3-mercaptopyruvate sulfurtransferase
MSFNKSDLVTADWLAGNLGAPGLVILDASYFLPPEGKNAREEYEKAHIPGAVFFDIEAVADPDNPLPHMLPSAALFEEIAAALGVSNDSQVVVYDAKPGFSAPRAWFTFRYFGHDKVAILDGGLKAWLAEGRPVESGGVEPARGAFSASAKQAWLRDKAAIAANLESRAEQVVDARAAERFEGRAPEPRPGLRAGHIPGSRNVPWDALVQENGSFRAPAQIARIFADAGVDLEKPVVTSCGTGVTACTLAFGLHLTGHEVAGVYDGSWVEWGGAEDTEIETGPAS